MKKSKTFISLIAVIAPLFWGYSAVSQAVPLYAPLMDGIYSSYIGFAAPREGKAIIVDQKLFVVNDFYREEYKDKRIVFKADFKLNILPINKEGVEVINRQWLAYSGNNNIGYTGNFNGVIGTQNQFPAYLRNVIYTKSTGQSALDTISGRMLYKVNVPVRGTNNLVERVRGTGLMLKYNANETNIRATAEELSGEYELNTEDQRPALKVKIDKQGGISTTAYKKGHLINALSGIKAIKPVDQSKGFKNIYVIKSTQNEDIAGVATIKNENGKKNLEIVYLNTEGFYAVMKLARVSNYFAESEFYEEY